MIKTPDNEAIPDMAIAIEEAFRAGLFTKKNQKIIELSQKIINSYSQKSLMESDSI